MAYSFKKEFISPNGFFHSLWSAVFKSSLSVKKIQAIDIEEKAESIMYCLLNGEPEHIPEVKWMRFNFYVASTLMYGLAVVYQRKVKILLKDATSGLVIYPTIKLNLCDLLALTGVHGKRGSRNINPQYTELSDEEIPYRRSIKKRKGKRDIRSKIQTAVEPALENFDIEVNIKRSIDEEQFIDPEPNLEQQSVTQYEILDTGYAGAISSNEIDYLNFCRIENLVDEILADPATPEQDFGPTSLDELLDIYERNYQEGVKKGKGIAEGTEASEAQVSQVFVQDNEQFQAAGFAQITPDNVQFSFDVRELQMLEDTTHNTQNDECQLQELLDDTEVQNINRKKTRRVEKNIVFRDESTTLPVTVLKSNCKTGETNLRVPDPVLERVDLEKVKQKKGGQLLIEVHKKPIASCLENLIARNYTTTSTQLGDLREMFDARTSMIPIEERAEINLSADIPRPCGDIIESICLAGPSTSRDKTMEHEILMPIDTTPHITQSMIKKLHPSRHIRFSQSMHDEHDSEFNTSLVQRPSRSVPLPSISGDSQILEGFTQSEAQNINREKTRRVEKNIVFRDESTTLPVTVLKSNCKTGETTLRVPDPVLEIVDLEKVKQKKGGQLLIEVHKKPIASCLENLIARNYTTTSTQLGDLREMFDARTSMIPIEERAEINLSADILRPCGDIIESICLPGPSTSRDKTMKHEILMPIDTTPHITQSMIKKLHPSRRIRFSQSIHDEHDSEFNTSLVQRPSRSVPLPSISGDSQILEGLSQSEDLSSGPLELSFRPKEVDESIKQRVAHLSEQHGSFTLDLLCPPKETSRLKAAETFESLLYLHACRNVKLTQLLYDVDTGENAFPPIYIQKL